MFVARTERSIALAKHMAEALDVDLFDEHRRGRFREIVQNCLICAHSSSCLQRLSDSEPLSAPPQHCRNAQNFTVGR